MKTSASFLSLLLIGATLAAGCADGADPAPKQTDGAVGKGAADGAAGAGGQAGALDGGAGAGGGGATGSDAGGRDAARSDASGGGGAAGSDASGGADASAAPDAGSAADAATSVDARNGGADGAGAAQDTGPTFTLATCFADLPAALGERNVETKASANGAVKIRIAIDTEGRFGTSGTKPWGLVRFAIEQDGNTTCIKDRTKLVYTGSHHNCRDMARAATGDVTYELGAPDRAATKVTVKRGADTIAGPFDLVRTACETTRKDGTCESGGPCS